MNVTPAQAGVQFKDAWIPACAGMTDRYPDKELNVFLRIFLIHDNSKFWSLEIRASNLFRISTFGFRILSLCFFSFDLFDDPGDKQREDKQSD